MENKNERNENNIILHSQYYSIKNSKDILLDFIQYPFKHTYTHDNIDNIG